MRSQILAGADVDLYSLLSLLSPLSADRQITYDDLLLILKNTTHSSSCTLSFPEFTVAVSRYLEVICTTFPYRRLELGHYLAIVALLTLQGNSLLHISLSVLRQMHHFCGSVEQVTIRSSTTRFSSVAGIFNVWPCSRQRCHCLHVSSFCGGAHGWDLICPVSKSANKNRKRYSSIPVNGFHLSAKLSLHPDTHLPAASSVPIFSPRSLIPKQSIF